MNDFGQCKTQAEAEEKRIKNMAGEMSEEKIREEFEVWYGNTYSAYALRSWDGERYLNMDTDLAWMSWQAACAHKDAEFAKEREQLRALIAMHAESMKPFLQVVETTQGRIATERLSFANWHDLIKAANSSAESVAAWEAKKLEPLRMRIDELEQDLQTTADALITVAVRNCRKTMLSDVTAEGRMAILSIAFTDNRTPRQERTEEERR